MEYPIKLAGMIFGNRKYLCSMCGEEVEGFKDKASAAEFRLMGTCQKCQDKMFKGL